MSNAQQIIEVARQLKATTPLRKVFKEKLMLAAQAVAVIECVDAGEAHRYDEEAAIYAVLLGDTYL